MNSERESACFERVSETLKYEMEALKSEQLVEVKKCKGKKANGSRKQTRENAVLVDSIFMANSNEDSLETSGVQKTANVSTITRDLVPPLEDIQPVEFNDSKVTVEEYDIVTVIKCNDRKSESDSAEVTSKKATVEQKAKGTSERV
ncbi:hypothetical protein ACOME3_009617 [Neoechinorhynchus agilis]